MTASGNHQCDPARTVELGNGWRASIAVAPDGSETAWLVSPQPGERYGCACRSCAPHDQDDAPRRPRTTDTSTGSNA